jgi:predicted ATP-grasp superfamily ATP-dependent carboligase
MNQKYSTPAVVLGMSVNGLGVVRSLGRHGVPVFGLDSEPNRYAMASRYAQCMACPDPQKNPQGLLQFLKDIAAKNGGRVVLLPTSDKHNEFVHQWREQLAAFAKFTIPPAALMNKLLSKQGQYELAKQYHVSIPATFSPTSMSDVDKIVDTLYYPVIIKGLNTVTWREKFGDQKAIVVKSKDELIKHYRDIFAENRIQTVIQEIIQGDDKRHYKICAYINAEGKVLLSFTLQKIRQFPCDFGIGSSVISLWEPDVAFLGLQFMKNMGYLGVGSIEFKRDARDEKLKMIEINPRLWAQNSLADACGQNFPMTVYRDLTEGHVTPQNKFKEGIKWIAFKEDRASFYGYKRQGRMGWGDWIGSVVPGPRVWANFSLDDPMPFFKETNYGLAPFQKVFRKVLGQ